MNKCARELAPRIASRARSARAVLRTTGAVSTTALAAPVSAQDMFATGQVAAGGLRVITLPPGALVDLSYAMAITAPTLITGGATANATLRGCCGAGGLFSVSGATLRLSNLTLEGVALGASGSGTALELVGVRVSWAGCGCSAAAPIARVDGGGTLRLLGSTTVCAGGAACSGGGGSCDVAVESGGAVIDVEVSV
jgi:hypothetical protein